MGIGLHFFTASSWIYNIVVPQPKLKVQYNNISYANTTMHYYDYEMSLGDLQPQDKRPNEQFLTVIFILVLDACTSHDVLGIL